MQLAMGSISPIELQALATLIIVLLAVMVVIFVALLDHQRKMAEIIRSDRKLGDGINNRVDAIQNQVYELQSKLANQAPNLQRQSTSSTSEEIQQRVN